MGLYDGVSILEDGETGTLWHHITGEALHGALAGRKMEVWTLRHLSVGEAVRAYPDLDVALSDRPVRGRSYLRRMTRGRTLPRGAARSILREDERRPTMDVGLGVWTDELQRYYPMERVQEAGGVLLDRFGERTLLVYVSPSSGALSGFFTTATRATWDGDVLRLDNRQLVRDGAVFHVAGARVDVEWPLQVFTRWYGFALTFPGTTVYGG